MIKPTGAGTAACQQRCGLPVTLLNPCRLENVGQWSNPHAVLTLARRARLTACTVEALLLHMQFNSEWLTNCIPVTDWRFVARMRFWEKWDDLAK